MGVEDVTLGVRVTGPLETYGVAVAVVVRVGVVDSVGDDDREADAGAVAVVVRVGVADTLEDDDREADAVAVAVVVRVRVADTLEDDDREADAVAVAVVVRVGVADGAVHDATPMFGVAPYRPALQLLHTPAPAREYVPAGQLTAVELVDPAGHTYPALQLPEHAATDMADVDPYRPGAQFVHTPAPATLYRPAGHIAAVAFVDPAAHAYPAVQSASHTAEDWPTVDP